MEICSDPDCEVCEYAIIHLMTSAIDADGPTDERGEVF